ncbi:acyl-CoA dehydrogenase family protein [Nocardia sp. NPDC052278]|uniref:acyl-CoA dehydrogenase family protein n=1 Tax=unclassified Nocardia TaxID=2637762 RepID=UPI0036B2E347
MTITDPPSLDVDTWDTPRHQQLDPTTRALRRALFGENRAQHTRVRTAMIGLGDHPIPGSTHDAEVYRSYAMLRRIVDDLGGSSRSIAADPALLGAVFDWAAVAAPRLLPLLSGHFRLVIGGIETLGDGTLYQQQCLAELDRADAIGALLHTELAGTNGTDIQTLAIRQSDGTFLLRTPVGGAVKFMPNVAEVGVPKTVIVTARLLVDGVDEGISPFLLRLRTSAGLAPGVHVARLPEKAWAPMDNAMIFFDDVVVPGDGFLGGDCARFVGGRLVCELSLGQRFHRTISPLQNGRSTLASAAVAGARAGMAITWHYARQRRPGHGPWMSERDAVLSDMTSAVAQVYAMTVLARDVRDHFSDADATGSVRAMLAKPIISNTALNVLSVCRQRCAAQGALRVNYLTDWAGNVEGIITAEGENQVLQVTTGKLARQVAAGRAPSHMDIVGLQVCEPPTQHPWWRQMLLDRETTLAISARSGETRPDALGADSAAIELSTATAERLAADSLLSAAEHTPDRRARALLEAVAAVYGLERVRANGNWFASHHLLTPELANRVDAELTTRRRELVPRLTLLVDAFDIPPLPAPIASDNYELSWLRYAHWEQLAHQQTPAVTGHQQRKTGETNHDSPTS